MSEKKPVQTPKTPRKSTSAAKTTDESKSDLVSIAVRRGGIEGIDGIEAGCLAGLFANPHYDSSTAPERAAELASSIRLLLYNNPAMYIANSSVSANIGLIAMGVLSNPQTLIPEAPTIVADAVLKLAQIVSQEN